MSKIAGYGVELEEKMSHLARTRSYCRENALLPEMKSSVRRNTKPYVYGIAGQFILDNKGFDVTMSEDKFLNFAVSLAEKRTEFLEMLSDVDALCFNDEII